MPIFQAQPLAPDQLISKAESYFLQAEAALKGWGAGTVQALYESGVRAGFEALGLSSEATAYLTSASCMHSLNRIERGMNGGRTGYPYILHCFKRTIIGLVIPE
ncbi:hypothetical protein FQR65_LT16042 [Abscondita terminalis]|nr:hypothetical protein FQR65_LT16042 [Abscondita terminalis]